MQNQFNPWMFVNPNLMNPNIFQSQMMNIGGNANWASSYTGLMNNQNMNMNQNINTSFNPMQNQGNKMNLIFKTTSGNTPINILFDPEKTVEELIHIFFLRVNREDLFQNGGVHFLHNASKIDYHLKTKVKDYFRTSINPTIMVMDVNNLIGA